MTDEDEGAGLLLTAASANGWRVLGRAECATITVPGSEEHTSELQSHVNLVCRLLLEKKKIKKKQIYTTHFKNFTIFTPHTYSLTLPLITNILPTFTLVPILLITSTSSVTP